MLRAEFEPMNPTLERAETINALYHKATVITSRENGNEYDIQGEFTPSIAGSKI
jgi:hypothetical protein